MSENRFVLSGILGGAAALIIYFVGSSLLVALPAGVAVFAVLAVLLKPERKAPVEVVQKELPELIREGEASLAKIRTETRGITDPEVSQRTDEICFSVQKILNTLKQKPDNVPNVRKFFNYYLPTLQSLLTRYAQIEQSGVAPSLQEKMCGHLGEIQSAMRKLHANLYEKDLLDMSVEMQVMTTSCIQDGLLKTEDFSVKGN